MKNIQFLILALLFVSCSNSDKAKLPELESEVFLVVLGIAQDAGYPQANCTKACCTKVWNGAVKPEKVVSLGLVDRPNNKVYLFEATPDFKDQLHELLSYLPKPDISSVGGIFLTHAHIGHYTGLMQLGHEAMGASNVTVYAMPRMQSFLTTNGPWSQLVSYGNIDIKLQKEDSTIQFGNKISITPFIVPHRDEYSETVGYRIEVKNKSALFIPDINKWNKWERSIVQEVGQVDYAFLDATFLSTEELPGRDMSQIPHPFVPETIALFDNSDDSLKSKIVLIHFNHTNPLMHNGKEYEDVLKSGYKVAREGSIYRFD